MEIKIRVRSRVMQFIALLAFCTLVWAYAQLEWGLPQGVRITSHIADVSNEAEVLRFRDEAAAQHATDRVHLLFNNAGISGGGSMIVNDRSEWERTFNICWGGVYLNTRAFLPLLPLDGITDGPEETYSLSATHRSPSTRSPSGV